MGKRSSSRPTLPIWWKIDVFTLRKPICFSTSVKTKWKAFWHHRRSTKSLKKSKIYSNKKITSYAKWEVKLIRNKIWIKSSWYRLKSLPFRMILVNTLKWSVLLNFSASKSSDYTSGCLKRLKSTSFLPTLLKTAALTKIILQHSAVSHKTEVNSSWACQSSSSCLKEDQTKRRLYMYAIRQSKRYRNRHQMSSYLIISRTPVSMRIS